MVVLEGTVIKTLMKMLCVRDAEVKHLNEDVLPPFLRHVNVAIIRGFLVESIHAVLQEIERLEALGHFSLSFRTYLSSRGCDGVRVDG